MRKRVAYIIAMVFFAAFLFTNKNTAYAAISSGSVTCNTPGDCVAGDTGATYNVSFTTNDASTASAIYVTFPNSYAFTNNAALIASVNIGGTIVTPSFNLSGNTVNIMLPSSYNLSGKTVTFSIVSESTFTNPSANGVTGNFTINTNASGEVAQTNVTGVTITGGTWALNYGAGTGGTITGTASQTVANAANGTAVTAVPNAGYTFVNWTGTVTTTQNPLTSTDVLNNISETANFAVIPTSAPILTLPGSSQSYSDGNTFTVEYTVPQSPQAGSITVTFSPTPSGTPIVLTLTSPQPGVQTSVSFPVTGGLSDVQQITGSTSDTIPDGTYNVTLAYEAIGAGAPSSTTANNVSIVPVTPPSVTTVTSLSEIGQTTATLKGYLTSGGGTVAQTGFRYDTDPTLNSAAYFPGLYENYEGAPILFIDPLTNLSCGTTYYYQAYAENTAAIETGNIQSFTTLGCETGEVSGGNPNVTWTPSTGFVNHTATPAVAPLMVSSPTVPAVSTAPIITTILKYGMNTAQVKILQQHLNTHGFILASQGRGSPGHENTSFGTLTKNAVMKFEKAHGLAADGIVGPKVLKIINAAI